MRLAAIRNNFTVTALAGFFGLSLATPGGSGVLGAEPTIVNQLVEQRVSPVGIDAKQPRFSWQLNGSASGLRQTAYHLQVTSGAADHSVVWDSGWVDTDQSLLVAYAGQPLRSSSPYFWRLQIKDENRTESAWSESARWVTGLLDAEKELRADWIGFDQPYAETPHGEDWFSLSQAKWICDTDATADEDEVTCYRTKFEVSKEASRLMVGLASTFPGQLFFNGVELFQGGKFAVPRYIDLTPWMRPGQNQLGFRSNPADRQKTSDLILAVRIEEPGAKRTRYFSDATWETTHKPVNLWANGEQPGDGWKPAKVLGKPGEGELPEPKFDSKSFMPPPVYLRKEIELRGPVRFAVFHGTAQGLYDLHVNGQRLTPTGFQPGWTQFEKHLSYVSTDVTQALKAGRNAIGVVLADGWFRGNLLWMGRENFAKVFGDKLRFSGQLEVEYTDGTRESFGTDSTWKAAYGPILQADIYNGEIYDARREQAGWDNPNFAEQDWRPVVSQKRPAKEEFIQRAHPTEPVREELELTPQRITEPRPGIFVVDFGQNFAGWARLKVAGRPGQTIYLRFAEDVNPDGTIYTANLRTVNPADRYICKGGGEETWEPRFTYHGFRYVQIVGLNEKPDKNTLIGIVAHSGGPITSHFESSSPLLNRIYQNVTWSQRANYFETMTDCPQRDERYGWTGDAHFFLPTAAYNQNGASFFSKWFEDCVDTQKPKTGNISNGAPGNRPGAGNASLDWSVAMMMTPWIIWQRYGDPQPILNHYAALRLYMTQWEKFAAEADAPRDDSRKNGRNRGEETPRLLGDWLALEKGTSRDFIGRVFGYLLSRQMAEFAHLAGHPDDVRRFSELAAHFRAEIISQHISRDGTVTGDTETAYALVCRHHLCEPAQEALIRAKFQHRMQANQFAVLTGFNGTGNLLPGLTEMGLLPEAAKTILNEVPPSWGGMVKLGATTIWERWDGKSADGTFHSPGMNSFNHYTFGGCGEWMMGYLVGLRVETPGFKIIHVEPAVVPGLNWVAGSFESPYGAVSNRWERKDGRITMRLVIPPNSTARVILPPTAKAVALQGAAVLAPAPDGWRVGAGTHEFTWTE